MMGKSYQRKTNRSRRKMQKLDGEAVTVELADGKAAFQMTLPFSEMLFDVATDGNGVAVFVTSAEAKKPAYTFCVDAVTHATLTYNSGDNVETCDSYQW